MKPNDRSQRRPLDGARRDAAPGGAGAAANPAAG